MPRNIRKQLDSQYLTMYIRTQKILESSRIVMKPLARQPELFLFTAAKNYGHKCFITERKQREMGHNTEPLFVNKPPDVSSKPTEKRGLPLTMFFLDILFNSEGAPDKEQTDKTED